MLVIHKSVRWLNWAHNTRWGSACWCLPGHEDYREGWWPWHFHS